MKECFKTVNLMGIGVHAMTMMDVIDACDHAIENKEALLLGVVNVAKLVNTRKNPELKRSVEEADIIVADGLPVVWLSRWCGNALPERVAGIDIMMELLKRSNEKGYSVYFLGAKQEVVEKVAAYTAETYPGVKIAGIRNGYFTESEEHSVAEDIKNSQADILFVAITPPKKENFLRRWSEYMQVPVCHGVGGSFDVVAGVTKRAPLWMQKCALEWLYRVIQEPKRMWKRYLVTNTKFICLSVGEVFKHRFHKTQ